jgi:tetratricopeptide (TPR) repeat protein
LGVYLEQIRVQPSVHAYVGAGLSLKRMQEYAAAVPFFQKGLDLDPNSMDAHFALALTQFSRAERSVLQGTNDPDAKEWFRDAIAHARRTVELKPDHAKAYLIWGLGLKYLGEPNEAIKPLRRGVACRPESLELQLALGEILLQTGDHKEARIYLGHAQKLDPTDQRVMEALGRLPKQED